MKPKCDMLIDQNTTVGHCCMNDATHRSGEYLICNECAKMLEEEPLRITIPARGNAHTWIGAANRYIKEAMICALFIALLASTATALPPQEEAIIVAAVDRNVPDATLRPCFVRLLRAIRKTENGRHGFEFGVEHRRAESFVNQAGWCAAICMKRWDE